MQILGIGANGHIGFNEPARALSADAPRHAHGRRRAARNAALFGGDPSTVPAEALSMGMATILQARAIVLLATGIIEGDDCRGRSCAVRSTPELPASFLQLHHDVEVMLDEPAASGLAGKPAVHRSSRR